jgi:hypothetical protein
VRVEVSFTHPETGEDLIAICEVAPGMPGYLYGPPECCWPEEPLEVDIVRVTADDFPPRPRPDVLAALHGDPAWNAVERRIYRSAVEAAAESEE